MKSSKIEYTRRDKTREVEGTLEELTRYFSYTLEVGKSYDYRINTKPKTIKSLMSNLNRSFRIKEGCCYDQTTINLIQ